MVDIPDAAVGGREDAPVLARDVRVERVEESFIGFETEGCGSCVSNICAEVGSRLHRQLDLVAAPGALGGDLHGVEQAAQIFCVSFGRACGHARLTWFFYKLRSELDMQK